MFQKKTVFIIPGYKHKPKNKAYMQIAKAFKKEGYHTIPITIPWKQTTISENTEYFLKQFKKINRKNKYIIGFSLGAMIAFLAAGKVNVSGLILCSLSPYFKEDLRQAPKPPLSAIQQARFKDFIRLRYAALAKKIKTKQILMVYGSQEAKSLIKRTTETFDQISSPYKKLLPIKNTDHNLNDKKYLNQIYQITKFLN